jgi:hypothetical protein
VNVEVDMRQFRELATRFEQLGSRSLPFAMRNALNAVAFDARAEWQKRIKRSMTLRNKYTERSLRVEKVQTNRLADMQARVGSTLDYMAKQELGGRESAKGKHGVPIPTSSAAGQAMKARPRTKVVRRKNYLSAIQLARSVGGIRQRRNAVAIKLAKEKTGGVAYLDLGKRKGLFAIPKGKRAKPRMLYDLSRKNVRVRPRPTLEPTVGAVGPRILIHAERAIAYEVMRAARKASSRTP